MTTAAAAAAGPVADITMAVLPSLAVATTAQHEEAMRLLVSLLSSEERAWFKDHDRNQIRVVGSDGGLYFIRLNSTTGNIYQLDEHGCPVAQVCIAPASRLLRGGSAMYAPLTQGDAWLGQYLAIRYQEAVLQRTGIWGRGVCRLRAVPPGSCPCGCGMRVDDPWDDVVTPPPTVTGQVQQRVEEE